MIKEFGKYELRQLLGKGGMAWVYLAWDKVLARQVALKIPFPQLIEDEVFVARFEREARSAAAMQHENIIRIHEMGRFEGTPYIDMEYLDGWDLKTWLEKHGTPPVEIALLMVCDICRGLEHAHAPGRDIVHRDMKPSNVMFTREGLIKIMDFGLARRAERDSALTQMGLIVGTVPYMSPEQSAGQEIEHVADLKLSDIFSTGIVAYELLGGRRPFAGNSPSEVSHAIQKSEPPSLGDLNPVVPEEVVAVIHRMLQKLVSKRCPSISLVVEELESAIERMGIRRERAVMRDFAQDPQRVEQELRRRSLSRHLDQGLYYESMGLGKIGDALHEFQCVLHLDPAHSEAREHLARLERERRPAPSEADEPEDRTMVAPPPAPPPPGRVEPRRPPEPEKPREKKQPPPPAPPPSTWVGEIKPPPAPKPARAPAARRGLVGRIAGAVVVVAVVIAALLWWRHDQATRATLTVRTTPPDASVRLDAASPRPAEAKYRGLRAGAHWIVIGRDNYRQRQMEVVLAPGRDTVVAVTLEAIPPGELTASLAVVTTPAGAYVTVDGARRQSPTTFDRLPPGDHALRAELAGYVVESLTVRLTPRRDTTLQIALRALPPGEITYGTIRVQTVPPAHSTSVDDTLRVAGLGAPGIRVRSGTHRVTVRHPDLGTKTWANVRVAPNQTVALTWEFPVTPGWVKVLSSTDVWGWIWVDGVDQKRHTTALLQLPPGLHKIRLAREGFSTVEGEKSVRVRAGDTTLVEFKVVTAR